MRDKSKELTVVNTGKKPSGNVSSPSFYGKGVAVRDTFVQGGGVADIDELSNYFLSKVKEDKANAVINFIAGLKIAGATVNKVLKTNSNDRVTDESIMSAARIIREIESSISKLEDVFLSKIKDDRTPFKLKVGDKLTSEKGIQIGETFVPGILTGSGGFFDENANGEVESLIIRRFLEVPELRYNRVEIKLGDKWNAPGAGVIERVDPDSATTGTAWLKLEDGEYGAIAVGDICMGIFHSMNADDNAKEDSDDSFGNFQFAGFYTCYFTITEITGKDNRQFRYQMRPVSDRWKLTIHPSAAMTFVSYGSFNRVDRQTSVYTTRTYTRLLKNQNTWEISAANIAMQYGNMENMNLHGIDMTGYSIYLNNIYMTGTMKQMKPDGTPVNVANDRGEWERGTKYDYYDRVSYLGSLWLCINENGTDTEPKEGDSSWLCQVKSGSSIQAAGRWESKKTPYPVNSIVTFAEKVWISNKETSEPPFGTYTDIEENRLVYADGGYVLVETLIQSHDWDLLLDAPQLTDGRDGESLQVRYSSDKVNWHSVFESTDVWMQQRVGDDSTWSAPIRIAGEKGAAGADGTYYDYQFAVNDSLTDAPTSGWQDTPPVVEKGQYLWMRTRFVNPNSQEENPWSVARIGGEKGEQGDSITNMGAWKSGMAVPYLGMVTMGGKTFMSKVATNNPPMWIYTDKASNRFIYKDGGYVLTGEMNTEEYDLVMQDGKDGRDGKGYEYIYIHTKDDNRPSTPTSEQTDDYIPSGWHDDPIGVTATMPYEWVSMRTKKDDVWSDFSTPGIWAKYSIDAILADLDNEMDNIAITSDGVSTSESTIAITASMYYGSAKQALTSIQVGSVSGISSSYVLNTGIITLKVSKGMKFSDRTEVPITISASINGKEETRTLKFTLAAIRGGADGASAVLYDIITSVSSIGKRKDGSYTVNGVSATRMKTVGDKSSETTDGTLKYSIDGGAEVEVGNNSVISSNKIGNKIQFIFYNADGVVVDKESVPMVIDGSDGDGFSMMGNWKTGLAVPKMGIVSMALEQYAAKSATTNPPLWCWTDKDGNRLVFSATEYILTGEKNTTEYEQWTVKGTDGHDGTDGKDGQQGIQGCVVRDSEWVVGVEYRNDEGIGNGYIDVALVRSESTATGWVAYRCKKTHTSSASITTTNTTYWEEFGSNVTAIFTSLIIAKNAKINFLQGNQLLIQKNDGKVTAGLSGGDEGEKVRFWAGSDIPDSAPFRVDEAGNIIAEKGTFGGYLKTTLVDIDNSDATPVPSKYDSENFSAYRLNKNVYVDATFCEVVLPCSEDYSGVRVIIMDTYYTKSRVATRPTLIRTEDGSKIACGLLKTDALTGKYLVDAIQIDCGTVELIYKSYENEKGIKENGWIVISQSCGTFEEFNGIGYN